MIGVSFFLLEWGKASPESTAWIVTVHPFLWFPAALQHFASAIWNYVMIGLEREKVERWVEDGKWKRAKFFLDDFNGILSVKAKKCEKYGGQRPLPAFNGGAILPSLPMDEYFSTAREPQFIAPSCSHVHFSFLFISPTWENNGEVVFSSRCELNALLHTEVVERGVRVLWLIHQFLTLFPIGEGLMHAPYI